MKIAPEVINEKMGVSIKPCQIVRCHRVGRKKDGANRPIIIRFDSDITRDRVFRAKKGLKTYNLIATNKIFLNEDLTARRARLAYET